MVAACGRFCSEMLETVIRKELFVVDLIGLSGMSAGKVEIYEQLE